MKNKKNLVLSVIAIVMLLVVTIGVSYAFFSYTKKGTTENSIKTGTITFLYTEVTGVGKGIKIEDSLPISDDQGKLLTGSGNVFEFKITSDTLSNTSIPYEVTARKSSNSTLDEKAVKVYLTEVDGEESELLLDNYSNLKETDTTIPEGIVEKTLYKGKVPANTTKYEKNFKLRMWLDEGVDFSPVKDDSGNDTYPYNGKTFTLTVNVYANANVVTESDKAQEANANIKSVGINNSELTKVEDKEYQYETTLPEGTTEAAIDIETENEYSTVKVEKIDSLVYNETRSNIKRLSTKKTVELNPGDNYFKITTVSLTGVKKISTINIRVGKYKESILNETDPILNDTLIPVIIMDDGTVQKVDTNYAWYDYESKNWANAVILKGTDSYDIGDIIPEGAIESYFVWIPRYKYQIFNTGSYTGLTEISNSVQTINVVFENKSTTPSNGSTNGSYLTHPAFTSLDVNGIWVGKFETGYDGATSTSEAAVNAVNTDKIVIKPNSYSWRNITVGKMFKNSYDYRREMDSHMMKNTEWGAVAYLQHSKYGSQTSVRFNNNSSYITGYASTLEPTLGFNGGTSVDGNRVESTSVGKDGTYTINYFNKNSNVASTTNNYSGIYDLSGGAWDTVMGYTTGATTTGGNSGITSLYSDFFTNNSWNKYYDKYSSTGNKNYNKRILGDATGELGPFESKNYSDGTTRYRSSWYEDYAHFVYTTAPWFERGGSWYYGNNTGMFSFTNSNGGALQVTAFRIVLTPNE